MNEPPLNWPAGRLPPVTDSPWFWLVLFGTVGLAALTAISPKYGRRQAPIERKYQARQHMQFPSERAPEASESTPPVDLEYSSAGDTIVKLWPIRAVALVAIVIAAVALVRQRIAQHRTCTDLARDK